MMVFGNGQVISRFPLVVFRSHGLRLSEDDQTSGFWVYIG